MRTMVFIISMLLSTPLFADYPLEIIELQSRPMEEVLPIIRPFVASDGAVSGMNNQLILRTSPDSLRDIRAILNRIDRPPRRLLISVRHGQHSNGQAGGISADINAMIGKRAKVIVGQPVADGTVRLQGLNADTRSENNLINSIQTIEGKPAFIATGESIPVTTHRSIGDGYYPHYRSDTRYYGATAGFYALPRLNGQHVTVELTPHLNRPGRTPDSFEVMQAATSVSGRLGEWLNLGGTLQSQSNRQRDIGFSASSRQTQEHNIWLKVEEIR